jgi:hypothetical protein
MENKGMRRDKISSLSNNNNFLLSVWWFIDRILLYFRFNLGKFVSFSGFLRFQQAE